MSTNTEKLILIFDVDGTLSAARKQISQDFMEYLQGVRAQGVPLAVVGGSDLCKIIEQLGDSLEDVQQKFDFLFSENGLVGFKGNEALPTKSIQEYLGEDKLQTLINWTLKYFSTLQLPVKRGNFVEFRKGMLNLCPVGRSCSYEERLEFHEYDTKHGIRETLVKELSSNFSQYGLEFAIGGQISVDVYPIGWDKTYCLQFLEADYKAMHFFGDKTSPGGNDHAIFVDPRTVGHTVQNPEDTRSQMEKLLKELGY